MLTSVKRLLLLHATIHAKLHMLLLTMSNFFTADYYMHEISLQISLLVWTNSR